MSDWRPGDILDVWEGGDIVSGVVLGEEKGRLRVVTEHGGEIRILASRIALRAGRGAPADPGRGAEAAARHAAAARLKADQVDVASLWEILVDAGGRHGVGELASLALGGVAAENASAVFRRLSAEKIHFERKGDLWQARDREAVAESFRRLRALAEKSRRRESFIERARRRLQSPGAASGGEAGAAGPPDPISSDDASFLESLVDLAVFGDEASARKEALGLLEDLGGGGPTPALGAFDLLRLLGIFTPDENLDIRRFSLRSEFPPEVGEAAKSAASRAPLGGRRDLTRLEAFTVDDEETVEIDDALSWEGRDDGSGVAGIHIADPAAFILPGDPVDEEALKRAATYYLPDRRLPMIPAAISEDAASLVPGRERPAMSVLVEVDGQGRVRGFEIAASVIRSRERLTYDETDALLSEPDAAREGGGRAPAAWALAALSAVAAALEADRAAAGAVIIRAPEVIVKVAPDGTVRLKRVEDRGPSRRLVAEFMILVNRLAADFCRERKIPAIYRRQPPPEKKPEPLGVLYDPVAVRAVRRSLRRGEVSLAPSPHYALGLAAYLQVTSPLRRYQDLAVQRQIEAVLAGSPLPHDAESMARIAATTEEAERAARRIETGAAEYFILKHLAARAGETVEGVVVAVDPRRTEVEIQETLTVAGIAPRPGHAPGARVRLVIEEARPRQGFLRLREIG